MAGMDEEARRQVQELARLFRERGLADLEVRHGSFRLHLRRDAPRIRLDPPVSQAQIPVARPSRAVGKGHTVAVRSPLLGVFYRAAAPDAPPFVEVGDMVSEGQTVCVVEAMKVFNEIKTEWSGEVVAIPAQNGALVQAGDPLVVIQFPRKPEQEEA